MDPASHVLGRLLGTYLVEPRNVVSILRPAPLQEGARTRLSIFPPSRDVAQLGSAPEWGSEGRRFESGRPD